MVASSSVNKELPGVDLLLTKISEKITDNRREVAIFCGSFVLA